jgi:ubiquinone/menaquinone biosynthesis C-methylase UbiE
VDASDALTLIRFAVPAPGGTWADIGAGTGVFTRALAQLLGPDARIFAVDRDPAALDALRALAARQGRGQRRGEAGVIPIDADFTTSLTLPGLDGAQLDGALVANALHFIEDPAPTLAAISALVRQGGRVVVVEYDGRPANRWVPHPIGFARLAELAPAVGLRPPTLVGTRPSTFGGRLYAAVSIRG